MGVHLCYCGLSHDSPSVLQLPFSWVHLYYGYLSHESPICVMDTFLMKIHLCYEYLSPKNLCYGYLSHKNPSVLWIPFSQESICVMDTFLTRIHLCYGCCSHFTSLSLSLAVTLYDFMYHWAMVDWASCHFQSAQFKNEMWINRCFDLFMWKI